MRPVPLIALRSLRQHALSTVVTALSVALALGLLMTVVVVQTESVRAFTGGSTAFDAVLGARGSALQLVLNTVFHLETSPGNVPWSLYEAIRRDPRVTLAVPYAVGDSYRGFRIVGTTDEIFGRIEVRPGEALRVSAGGRAFDPARREAVIGALVAERTGLAVGVVFHPAHGVAEEGHEHEEDYVVTGVLAPSNTPADRVIWIPIEGIFRMGGHVLRGGGAEFQAEAGEAIPDEHKEVSAVMLKLRSPQDGFTLSQQVNRQGTLATLAWPIGRVMADLFEKIGWMHRVLELVAVLVALVAAASILASVHNTIHERRREFAILRALGARRRTIFGVILFETTAIAGLGCVIAFGVHAVLMAAIAASLRDAVGVMIDPLALHAVHLWGPIGMLVLGAAAGVLPAVRAYMTNVAESLAQQA
jgi:putative ABC transport system permease protein